MIEGMVYCENAACWNVSPCALHEENQGLIVCPHYITGNYVPSCTFLDDEKYGICLDNIVKACCDILLLDEQNRVLIGKRNTFPQKAWWYGCGGRMKPGESPIDSMKRLLKRELRIDLTLEAKLDFVGAYSYVWGMRHEPPQNHGAADISIVHSLSLPSDSGLQSDHLFDDHKWVSTDEILSGDYHPALKQAVADFLKVQKLKALERLVTEGVDQSAIVSMCKQIFPITGGPVSTSVSE